MTQAPHLFLSLLGAPRITLAQHGEVTLTSRKAVALLAYLAVECGHAHSRESLLGLLWPDMPDADARNNLRVTWAQLTARLVKDAGDAQARYLHANRLNLQFTPNGNAWLDVAEFQNALDACERHPHERRERCDRCMARLSQVMDLYRGEFMAGFHLEGCQAFEEWLFAQRERLHVQAMETLDALGNFHEHVGNAAEAGACARRQIELDPLQESGHQRLMRMLAMQGERNAALIAFERCRVVLNESLGIEPEPETRALYAKILADATPARSNLAQLPQPLTSFIGRDEELAELQARLAAPGYRLLSIVGPGGIGKTRLAQQVAAQQFNAFPDGVYFVALANVRAAEFIPTTIADVMGIPAQSGSKSVLDQLIDAIGTRRQLFVLDNFEHLIDGVDLLMTLLRQAPNVVLLVTSRERLNVQAEDLFELRGLPVPADDAPAPAHTSAAIRLFVDRAHRLDKRFKLTPDELPHIVRICQLVEGFPLAIELAASWIGDLTCHEIAQELSSGLDLLQTTLRDIDPAHRSLRAVFNSSWQLLSKAEQHALAGLSVFRGGFSVDAARSIFGVTPAILNDLRNKSLLRNAGSRRYDMHALVQQFSSEALEAEAQSAAQARELHGRYFLRLFADQAIGLDSRNARTVCDLIQPDWQNIASAWRQAVAHENAEALRNALDSLIYYCQLRGLVTEAQVLLAGAVACFEKPADHAQDAAQRKEMLCQLLTAQASLLRLYQMDTALTLSQTALALAYDVDNTAAIVTNLRTQATVFEFRTDFARGIALAEQGLQLAQAHGLELHAGACVEMIGYMSFKLGDYARATHMLSRLQEIHDKTGRLAVLSLTSIGILGCMALDEGRYEAGLIHFQRELEACEAMGDKRQTAAAQHVMACAWFHLGYYPNALALDTLSTQGASAIGDKLNQGCALLGKAWAHRQMGQLSEALACATEAVSLVRGLDAPVVQTYALAQLAEARLALAQTEADWAEAEDTFAKVADVARASGNLAAAFEASIGLAELAHRRGRLDVALDHIGSVLPHLPTVAADSWAAPIHAYVVCTRILLAANDPAAEIIRDQGLRLLDRLAQHITDPSLRQNFLDAVPAHRELRELQIAQLQAVA